MGRTSPPPGGSAPRRKPAEPGPAARQEAASRRLAESARRTRTEQRDARSSRRQQAERERPAGRQVEESSRARQLTAAGRPERASSDRAAPSGRGRTAPGAGAAAPVAAPESGLGLRTTGLLLRFVSCGILALALGLTWRLTLAPQRLGIGSTALGALFLLAGFAIGGILWYVRDARLRMRDPGLISDERIIFSFVVFALMPFCVLAVLFVVWVIALIVGSS